MHQLCCRTNPFAASYENLGVHVFIMSSHECKKILSAFWAKLKFLLICKIQFKTYFKSEWSPSNFIFMSEIQCQKPINKTNYNTKWLLQNDQNTDMTFLHSHEDVSFFVIWHNALKVKVYISFDNYSTIINHHDIQLFNKYTIYIFQQTCWQNFSFVSMYLIWSCVNFVLISIL